MSGYPPSAISRASGEGAQQQKGRMDPALRGRSFKLLLLLSLCVTGWVISSLRHVQEFVGSGIEPIADFGRESAACIELAGSAGLEVQRNYEGRRARAGSSQPRSSPGGASLRDGVAGSPVAVQQSPCATTAASAVQSGDRDERHDTRSAGVVPGFGGTGDGVWSACQTGPRCVSFARGGGAEGRASGDRRGSQSAGRWQSLRESRSRAAYQRRHLLQPRFSGGHSSSERGEHRSTRDGIEGGDLGARRSSWRFDQGLESDHQGTGSVCGGGCTGRVLRGSQYPRESALAVGCSNVDGRHASRVPTDLPGGGGYSPSTRKRKMVSTCSV